MQMQQQLQRISHHKQMYIRQLTFYPNKMLLMYVRARVLVCASPYITHVRWMNSEYARLIWHYFHAGVFWCMLIANDKRAMQLLVRIRLKNEMNNIYYCSTTTIYNIWLFVTECIQFWSGATRSMHVCHTFFYHHSILNGPFRRKNSGHNSHKLCVIAFATFQ